MESLDQFPDLPPPQDDAVRPVLAPFTSVDQVVVLIHRQGGGQLPVVAQALELVRPYESRPP